MFLYTNIMTRVSLQDIPNEELQTHPLLRHHNHPKQMESIARKLLRLPQNSDLVVVKEMCRIMDQEDPLLISEEIKNLAAYLVVDIQSLRRTFEHQILALINRAPEQIYIHMLTEGEIPEDEA